MIIIFGIIIIILFFYLHQNKEDLKVEKLIHNTELEKLNILRNDPLLNERYTKTLSICNKLIRDFKDSNLEDQKIFKFKVIQKKAYTISAFGFVEENINLTTYWSFTPKNDMINLHIKLKNNSIELKENFIEFKFVQSEEEIIDYVKNYVSL